MRLKVHNKCFARFVAVTGLLVASAPAMAETLLPPGGSVTPPPTVTAPSGTVLADTGMVSFTSSTGVDMGMLQEQVIQDPSNPNGANKLDFVFQVKVTSGFVATLNASNYTGFTTFIAQALSGPLGSGTDASTQADRSADGSAISFSFGSGIPNSGTHPGISYAVIIYTDATNFGQGVITLANSGNFEDDSAFGPAPPNGGPTVPEPASVVLLTSCMLGLGGSHLWRCRKRALAAA